MVQLTEREHSASWHLYIVVAIDFLQISDKQINGSQRLKQTKQLTVLKYMSDSSTSTQSLNYEGKTFINLNYM